MEEQQTETLSPLSKIINLFSAPEQTYASLDEKPTWFLPFVISVIAFWVMQYFTMDIQAQYRLAIMEAKDMPAEQLAAVKQQMTGLMKYIGLIIGPIAMLAVWAIIAGLLHLAANLFIGGETTFKKVFSVVSWTSLIGAVAMLIATALILAKGTIHGVATDLSLLMETPKIGAEAPMMYTLLGKFDIFVIWQLALWSIGLSVLHKSTVQKAMVPVGVLWVLWIAISVTFSNIFSNFGM